jgi:hypothetical protein
MRHELATPPVHKERQVYATRAEVIAIARQCAYTPAEREARALIRLAFYSGTRRPPGHPHVERCNPQDQMTENCTHCPVLKWVDE